MNHEGQGRAWGVGRAPLPRDHLGYRFALILLPENHKYSKKNLRLFFPFGLRLILGFYETKNMQQTGTGTGHWIKYVSPKNNNKSCQKYMKLKNIGMEQSKIIDTMETYH